jgi:hypothetical protein
LQERHLYQSVSVETDPHPFENDVRDLVKTAVQFAKVRVNGPWFPLDPIYSSRRRADVSPPDSGPGHLAFRPPDAKLFCVPCGRLEPFNLVSAEDFFSRDERLPELSYRDAGGNIVQLFVFSFQCQSCKGVPQALMVRRHGVKLTNTGRAPIEHVAVPSDIPKEVAKFFSGAIVAHQSGQTLAGLFMLRTLLEQFARMTTKETGPADKVMNAYMASLPDDFKGRFPSMRDLYGDLSVALHSAAGSSELFERARTQIGKHFETRRVFELP